MPVHVDELGLAVLGWECEARLRIEAEHGETFDRLRDTWRDGWTYHYTLSTTLIFSQEEWNTKFYDERRPTPLLLEVNWANSPEPAHKRIDLGKFSEFQNGPKRISDREKFGFSTELLSPEDFSAQILGYDQVRVDGFHRYDLNNNTSALPTQVFNQQSGPFVPEIQARAFIDGDTVIANVFGSMQVRNYSDLKKTVEADRWYRSEDDEIHEVNLPQIKIEIQDETGFLLSDISSNFRWFYPFQASNSAALRPPRFFMHCSEDLARMAGTPTSIVVRSV